MMLTDDHGRPVPYVGTGYKEFWNRPTNRYAGCSCPAWRYHPAHPKPTNPDCPKHGANPVSEEGPSLYELFTEGGDAA